jgi:hypothetical protein
MVSGEASPGVNALHAAAAKATSATLSSLEQRFDIRGPISQPADEQRVSVTVWWR